MTACESQLRVATARFERQRTLLSNGFTTRVVFDQAQEGLQSAEASLQDAKAQWGRARNALGDTELRAGAAGVITARKLEIGQVVDAGQSVFTLAQDGDRDVIFDVDERILLGDIERSEVALRLLSDSTVTALGRVREVSPAVDTKGFTVRVKVAIQNPAPAMPLGSAVAGTGKSRPVAQSSLPPSITTRSPGSNPVCLISRRIVRPSRCEALAIVKNAYRRATDTARQRLRHGSSGAKPRTRSHGDVERGRLTFGKLHFPFEGTPSSPIGSQRLYGLRWCVFVTGGNPPTGNSGKRVHGLP